MPHKYQSKVAAAWIDNFSGEIPLWCAHTTQSIQIIFNNQPLRTTNHFADLIDSCCKRASMQGGRRSNTMHRVRVWCRNPLWSWWYTAINQYSTIFHLAEAIDDGGRRGCDAGGSKHHYLGLVISNFWCSDEYRQRRSTHGGSFLRQAKNKIHFHMVDAHDRFGDECVQWRKQNNKCK